MNLNKFAYLYSKPLGNHTLKIMKKIPRNLLKNLEISWNFVSPKKWEPWPEVVINGEVQKPEVVINGGVQEPEVVINVTGLNFKITFVNNTLSSTMCFKYCISLDFRPSIMEFPTRHLALCNRVYPSGCSQFKQASRNQIKPARSSSSVHDLKGIAWLITSLQIRNSNNADVLLDSGLNLFDIMANLCSKLCCEVLLKSWNYIVYLLKWTSALDFNKRGCVRQI